MAVNHIRNSPSDTIPHMVKGNPSKNILWENLSALMRHHWEAENINLLARKAKIGVGTAQRIKDRETSVGLDIVDRVAGVFGLQAWQILLPNLNPKNVPVTMISDAEKRLYERYDKVKTMLESV